MKLGIVSIVSFSLFAIGCASSTAHKVEAPVVASEDSVYVEADALRPADPPPAQSYKTETRNSSIGERRRHLVSFK